MPHRPSAGTGQFVFHVYNRVVEGLLLFEGPEDYEAFLQVLVEAMRRVPIRLLTYALMSTHWHLVVWPASDGTLSRFMHTLTLTHARRWRRARGTAGRGALYQGRFRAVAVQEDLHLLRLCRYVERNPVKARLVARAEDWPWSGASLAAVDPTRPALDSWPVPKPPDWLELLAVPEPPSSLAELRHALRNGVPFGDKAWQEGAVRQLEWPFPIRKRGRPPGR